MAQAAVVTFDVAVSAAGADPKTAPPLEGGDDFAPMVLGGAAECRS